MNIWGFGGISYASDYVLGKHHHQLIEEYQLLWLWWTIFGLSWRTAEELPGVPEEIHAKLLCTAMGHCRRNWTCTTTPFSNRTLLLVWDPWPQTQNLSLFSGLSQLLARGREVYGHLQECSADACLCSLFSGCRQLYTFKCIFEAQVMSRDNKLLVSHGFCHCSL